MRNLVLAAAPFALLASHLAAQGFTTGACIDRTSYGNSSRVQLCELRHTVLPLTNGHLAVSSRSGGITVLGEDRSDISLDAEVRVRANTQDEARSLLQAVKIHTSGTIQDEGPDNLGLSRREWSVSYTLHVPRRLAANLHAENGGIHLSDLDGAITAETRNGGVDLTHLAGNVHATTVNGGVHVALAGEHWSGTGLVAHSTNGGVSVSCSDRYSAHLIAQTTNGRVRIGFPTSALANTGNRLDANLGQGGPTLDLETVNGGVHIDRN
jgi:DUF4097 and DUF4098 domain-containing protein YvlB